eukprot:COSAG01_NODE_524_length_15931_cov_72.340491_13_plen_222_part_00
MHGEHTTRTRRDGSAAVLHAQHCSKSSAQPPLNQRAIQASKLWLTGGAVLCAPSCAGSASHVPEVQAGAGYAALPPEITAVGADCLDDVHDGHQADVWSLGVALFVLACREYPAHVVAQQLGQGEGAEGSPGSRPEEAAATGGGGADAEPPGRAPAAAAAAAEEGLAVIARRFWESMDRSCCSLELRELILSALRSAPGACVPACLRACLRACAATHSVYG